MVEPEIKTKLDTDVVYIKSLQDWRLFGTWVLTYCRDRCSARQDTVR